MNERLVTLRPRYGEVDSMGVVYHPHYLVYFEVGRTEWMRAAGCAYADLERRGVRLAVVDAAVRYLQPARYDEELRLVTRVTQIGGASVTFSYELRGPAGLLATGHTRLGCLDSDNRPARLPPDARDRLGRGIRPGPLPSESP